MTRIYFNDKVFEITHSATVVKDADTLIINDDEIGAGLDKLAQYQRIILKSDHPEQSFEKFKKHFTSIQAAGGFVYDDNKALIIFRKGKWDLPKGKLDKGESIEVCAVREVEEETGLKNVHLKQLLHISWHCYNEKGKNILKETYWYLMKADSNQPLSPQKEEGIDECIWVDVKDLDNYLLNSYELVREVVEKGLVQMDDALKNSS